MSSKKNDDLHIYDNDIDFEDASNCWKENKRVLGGGCYKYLCAKIGINNNRCISKCLPGGIYCKTHLEMFLEGKLT